MPAQLSKGHFVSIRKKNLPLLLASQLRLKHVSFGDLVCLNLEFMVWVGLDLRTKQNFEHSAKPGGQFMHYI